MRPVVLVARPAPREGDLVLGAVVEQVGVDELAAVVRVDPEDREGKGPTSVLDRFGDKDRRLVGDRAVDRPARGDVGHSEGEAELPEAVPTLVADEVDLDKAGQSLVPLRPGPDGDLGLEQRTRLGMSAATQLGEDLGASKAAVDGR